MRVTGEVAPGCVALSDHITSNVPLPSTTSCNVVVLFPEQTLVGDASKNACGSELTCVVALLENTGPQLLLSVTVAV